MAWRSIENLNQILHFWNHWVKGDQTVYRLSKSVDILEEAVQADSAGFKLQVAKLVCCYFDSEIYVQGYEKSG